MAKKSFKDSARNAASMFLSDPSSQEPKEEGDTKPLEEKELDISSSSADSKVLDCLKPLKKDKRLNLLINSASYEDLKKIAFSRQTSVNNLICETMQALISESQGDIDRYNAFMK